MRKRTLLVAVLSFVIAAFAGARTARAQEESKGSGASKPVKVEDSVDAYRLDVSFNELEDGKKLNTRHYSIDLTAEGRTISKSEPGSPLSPPIATPLLPLLRRAAHPSSINTWISGLT